MRFAIVVLTVGALIFAYACSDDDDGDTTCATGCQETMSANCSNGPGSQQQCETDCSNLLGGSCGTEYQALLNCSGGSVSCDGSGFPEVDGCGSEQTAFDSCLSSS